ncbi:MAG: hypothetical protein JW712_06425 [Dehalococcoidales bacterium]|nr:hypothetical protein [Dehalococcoidales bacterium]
MIYVECKPDTTIARTLSGGIHVEHVHGKSRVCNKLMYGDNLKGMVDRDSPEQTHPYIKEISSSGQVNELLTEELIIYNDTHRNNTLILLKPRLEEWILESSKRERISMKSYRLPETAEELHTAFSIGSRDHINNLRMLVQKLLETSNRVQKLASLLR